MMANAQVNATYPDDADYFIKGRVSIEKNANGQIEYKLFDVISQGISFEKHQYYWGREDGESVYFTLNKAKTDYLGGFDRNSLVFWRYDEDIQQWQTDSEFKPSTADFEETKQMVVMLLIDCSGSLKDEWTVAKESAIDFIDRMYNVSRGRGNIKIGIIGFSTIAETKTFEIEPLTLINKERMLNFIRYDLRQSDGTALFYAMDQGAEKIENYCRANIRNEDLAIVSMPIFTDGLDQISRNLDKDILTTDDYRIYVRQLKGKRIGNTSLCPRIFGLKGVDITTEAQLDKFRRIGEELSCKFVLMEDISQLSNEFTNLAKELTEEWQNLKCYAPNSYRGRVAWTFRNTGKPKPVVEKTREKRKHFFGINGGMGFYHFDYAGHSSHKESICLSGGVDLAFSLDAMANLGFFVSMGYEDAWGSKPFQAGPLLLIFNKKNTGALYLGGGITAAQNENTGFDFRVGYKFKKPIYSFAEFYGHKDKDDKDCFSYGIMVHIGYAF